MAESLTSECASSPSHLTNILFDIDTLDSDEVVLKVRGRLDNSVGRRRPPISDWRVYSSTAGDALLTYIGLEHLVIDGWRGFAKTLALKQANSGYIAG